MRSECRQECVEEWSWQGFTSQNYSKPIPSPVKPFFYFLFQWRCFMEMFFSERKIQALSAMWANSSWQDIALAMSFGCTGLLSTASFTVVISEQLAFLCYVVGLLDAGTHQIESLKGSQIILDANLNLKNKQKSRERGGQNSSTWVIQTCLHPDLKKIQLDPFVTLKSTQWEETLCKLEQPKQNRQAEAQCAEQAGKAGFANTWLSRRNMHRFVFFSGMQYLWKTTSVTEDGIPQFIPAHPFHRAEGSTCFPAVPIAKPLVKPYHRQDPMGGPTAIWLWLKWVLKDDSGVLGARLQEQSNHTAYKSLHDGEQMVVVGKAWLHPGLGEGREQSTKGCGQTRSVAVMLRSGYLPFPSLYWS